MKNDDYILMKDYAKIDTSEKPSVEKRIVDSVIFLAVMALVFALIALGSA